MGDTCPKCGSQRIGEPIECSGYACQFMTEADYTTSPACKDRQIARQAKRIAELEKSLSELEKMIAIFTFEFKLARLARKQPVKALEE